jgi:hypothetical protein
VVGDIPDGKNWRTIVWTATQGVPYLSLDRFGVSGGIAVEFIVAFPLLENGDPAWVEKVVTDFNTVCQSLKIDGGNSTGAAVHLGRLPFPQKKP